MGEPDVQEWARIAYSAYGEVVDWTNYRGDPMPDFDALGEKIQQAWSAAVEAILEAQ